MSRSKTEKRSGRRSFIKGLLCGILLVVVLAAIAAGLLWKHRYRLFERAATAQVATLSEHFFKALPEGYVTKNGDKVMAALDAFTNAVGRDQVENEALRGISSAIVKGLQDGALSYEELDAILLLMQRATEGK